MRVWARVWARVCQLADGPQKARKKIGPLKGCMEIHKPKGKLKAKDNRPTTKAGAAITAVVAVAEDIKDGITKEEQEEETLGAGKEDEEEDEEEGDAGGEDTVAVVVGMAAEEEEEGMALEEGNGEGEGETRRRMRMRLKRVLRFRRGEVGVGSSRLYVLRSPALDHARLDSTRLPSALYPIPSILCSARFLGPRFPPATRPFLSFRFRTFGLRTFEVLDHRIVSACHLISPSRLHVTYREGRKEGKKEGAKERGKSERRKEEKEKSQREKSLLLNHIISCRVVCDACVTCGGVCVPARKDVLAGDTARCQFRLLRGWWHRCLPVCTLCLQVYRSTCPRRHRHRRRPRRRHHRSTR